MPFLISPNYQKDCNFFWLSICLFVIFAFLVFIKKLAKYEDCYQKINKMHFLISLTYLPITITIALITQRFNFNFHFLTAISVGIFIYFSLHYTYLFALIGLVKKSISINILADAISLSVDEKTVLEKQLIEFQVNKSNGINFIRNDRLKQMIALRLAAKNEEVYSITKRGRFANYLRNTILKVWNLEQL